MSAKSNEKQGPVRAVPLDKVRAAKGRKIVPVPRSKVASTRAFRRVRSDRLAGAAGVLLVVVAAILLFTWPQPKVKEPPTFAIEWVETTHEAYNQTKTLRRNGDTSMSQILTEKIEITDLNVTYVKLEILWRDDVGDEGQENDNASVTLTGPAAANATLKISSRADRFHLANASKSTSSVGHVPDIREVEAKTEAEARAALGDRSIRNGTGTWTLTAQLLYIGDDYHDDVSRTSGQRCPEQPPQGTAVCQPDLGNDVLLRVTYRTYAPTFKPA